MSNETSRHLLFDGSECLVYQQQRDGDNKPVIIKVLKNHYPTPSQLIHLANEYEITRNLTIPGVRKALEQIRYDDNHALMLEYFDGLPLRDWLAKSLPNVGNFLVIAMAVSRILDELHRNHIVHKDINSKNILINPLDFSVEIIDLGISSRIDTRLSQVCNPGALEGTLAYISPEQTGRMNRAVDYRSDLYSLGVTFYEMLTGRLPFESADPMELVHSHIALQPAPPVAINPSVPLLLSDIVLKLLAKNAEDRYQSAGGLRDDLETALQQWQANGSITPFALSDRKHPGHFRIPQKLYGRAREIEALMRSFAQISKGAREMFLVTGYSGVGKSSLVHEVHKPMTEKRGTFITGKYDQYQRNIPYYALSQAFAEFCEYLLMESASDLLVWQQRIHAAVGDHGQVLVEVIPQLEKIIGPQPPVSEANGEEAQNRFNHVFRDFIKAMSQSQHPLILFVDDLQWADSASLNLLKVLMTDPDIRYFFVIGAYRDNEVDVSHPLMLTLEQIRKAQVTVHAIKLDNLSAEDVTHLVTDTLQHPKDSGQLVELIYAKTQGNAFFTSEFFKSLYQDQLLSFDFAAKRWQWDIEQIRAREITDNVVELMVGKIAKLPPHVQEILKLASCIGAQFDLETLQIIHAKTPLETLKDLWPAVEEGLLAPLDDYYKLIHAVLESESKPDTSFKFLHDRVQQAAYSLVPEAQRSHMHFRIGSLLTLTSGEQELGDKLFGIVAHLNMGMDLLEYEEEARDLAHLNLQAGQRAMGALAYGSARDMLQAGIRVAEWGGRNAWADDFDLMFELNNALALCEYRSGLLEASVARFHELMDKAHTPQQIGKVYGEAVYAYTTMNRYGDAVNLARAGMVRLGVDFPETITMELIGAKFQRAFETLGQRQVMDLLDGPEITDPNIIAQFDILYLIIPAAWLSSSPAFAWSVLHMVGLSHQHGNLTHSAFGYGIFALMLCAQPEQYATGYEYGRMSIELNKKYPSVFVRGTVHFLFNTFVQHWRKHKKLNPPLNEIAHRDCAESGAYVYATYNIIFSFFPNLFATRPIAEVEAHFRVLLAFVERINDRDGQGLVKMLLQLTVNLRGRTPEPTSLSDEHFDEAVYLAELLQRNYGNGICHYYFIKQLLYFTAGKYAKANEMAAGVEQYYFFLPPSYQQPMFHAYRALGLSSLWTDADAETRAQYRETISADLVRLGKWRDNCPDNFAYLYLLVEAELRQLDGESQKIVAQAYEAAIEAAREQAEILAHEALACERCGRFWLIQGFPRIARSYLQEAYSLYRLWGAATKVAALEAEYPHFLLHAEKLASDGHINTITATVDATQTQTGSVDKTLLFDLQTVLKASQAIAGEIVLDKLLDTLLRSVLENAGAQRGLLLIREGENLYLEAEGLAEGGGMKSLLHTPIDGYTEVPHSVLNYTTHAHRPVVLDDACRVGAYTGDAYIARLQVKSVLCMPIAQQGRLLGLLYLENNLAAGAFTAERLEILYVLSAQIAVSLNNALLYRTLEHKVSERTAELADANQEIVALNQRLQKENLRMGAELDVTRRIQQLILPTREELQNVADLEIAGFMEAATEVGGDYYDVLVHDGSVKIGIGDVTGHGLESGMLMLMTQMGVRALLDSDFQGNAAAFLNSLNRSLYGNVRRIHTDKNLTLCLLDYRDGKLLITGQHEEVLLIRKNARIERIDTFALGFNVGLEANVEAWTQTCEAYLEPGDGIVLYTDGITEAHDAAKQLYGLDRLCALLETVWSQNSEQIQQAVIADVKQHIGGKEVMDDITLVVIKRKGGS